MPTHVSISAWSTPGKVSHHPGMPGLELGNFVFQVRKRSLHIFAGENLKGLAQIVGQAIVINDISPDLPSLVLFTGNGLSRL